MKVSFAFLLIISIFFSACNKSDIEYENSFERSYDAWLKFKVASGDNYRYEASGATWTGSSWLTTITVREGAVVQRDFRYDVFNGVSKPDEGWSSISIDELLRGLGFSADDYLEQEGVPFYEILQWTETESELGIYEGTPAGRVQTLDDIYETARNVWLKKRNDAEVYFEANNEGLLSAAGFVPNGCMDDCFSGIHIRSIVAID